jgi:hypothetical protein
MAAHDDIEDRIRGMPADERRVLHQKMKPILMDLGVGLRLRSRRCRRNRSEPRRCAAHCTVAELT